jgi:hypothetical protein
MTAVKTNPPLFTTPVAKHVGWGVPDPATVKPRLRVRDNGVGADCGSVVVGAVFSMCG